MLTGYQMETVAFTDGTGGFLCPEHAAQRYSTIAVEKAECGLSTGTDLRPLSRFEADEYASEVLREYLAQELEGEALEAAWDGADLALECEYGHSIPL